MPCLSSATLAMMWWAWIGQLDQRKPGTILTQHSFLVSFTLHALQVVNYVAKNCLLLILLNFRKAVGNRVSLQGNLDPCGIYSSKEEIVKAVEKLVASFGRERWIANLGHGIYPDMDPDHLKTFIDSVHKFTQLK